MAELTAEFVKALRAVNSNLVWIAMTLVAILVVIVFKNMGGRGDD